MTKRLAGGQDIEGGSQDQLVSMYPTFLFNSAAEPGTPLSLAGPHGSVREIRGARKNGNWRVIHACEYARDILPVVEGQVAAGMRPYIVTPRGAGTAELYLGKKDLGQPETLSLLRAWQDVRNWRKSLLECDPENTSDLVHSHSFASGMAAVRNLSSVVYDVDACIEEFAISAQLCEPGSWMGRSFRVAEQFVFSRAQAVIVHSLGMKTAAAARGVAPENLFLILPPVPMSGAMQPQRGDNFLQERFGFDPADIVYFVPATGDSSTSDLSASLMTVLEALVLVSAELAASQLIIEGSPAMSSAIRGHAERLGIAEHVFAIEPENAGSVMRNATVVVATGEVPNDPAKARRGNQACLDAMTMGKPLLAADVPRNRDSSPDGRGCLWFSEGDIRDLGYRMAFLGHNSDFRTTLAASGSAYVRESRSTTAIGHQYDAAYRHASSRKKNSGPGQQSLMLLPIAGVI